MSARLILVAVATVIASFPQLFAARFQPVVRASSVSAPRLLHGVPQDTDSLRGLGLASPGRALALPGCGLSSFLGTSRGPALPAAADAGVLIIRAARPHPRVPAVLVVARSPQAAPVWRVAVLGDSLATGYGIGAAAAYPRVLERLARDEGWTVEVGVRAGNGHTTRDGLANARDMALWAPHVAVVALGGNDALRGTPAPTVRANLERLLATLRSSSGYLVVAGMRAVPSHGDVYGSAFHLAFRDAAAVYGAVWMPFLLEGVAARPEFNQADGVHPNAAGSGIVGANLWPYVRWAFHQLLER